MSTNATIAMEPEKDRWWLIAVSILYQQMILCGMLVFPSQMMHASSAPVLILWAMSFILPFAYLSPVSGRSYFRSCAKVGWLYVIAAFVWCMFAFLSIANSMIGGLSIPR
jgi:hypothetical protein